jgi:predicted metal-dependent HD superfamily phosphohydrolase
MRVGTGRQAKTLLEKDLFCRWRYFCAEALLFDSCDKIFSRILAAYNEEHRYYHNLSHLAYVLEHVEKLTALTNTPAGATQQHPLTAVRFAAFFHDIIYDITATDNEENSARMVEKILPEMGGTHEFVAEVARLVRLTDTHAVADGDITGAWLSDSDLIILAETPGNYAESVQEIRREYANIPEEIWQLKRIEMLQTFLAQPLFHLPNQEEAEERAHANIKSELAALHSI